MRLDAVADTPGEVANLRARAELMRALSRQISSWDPVQEEAGARLGITRPRLNQILRGKIGKFSLDTLVNLTASAGLALEITTSQEA